MPIAADHIRQLREILLSQDIRAALIYLNALTEHRFTALFLFQNETLKNHYFVDAEDTSRLSLPDIPVMASYCVFVRDRKESFYVSDSLVDDRVLGHAKRLEVQSYCGVPLRDVSGKVFGSICHFDFRPIPTSDANLELLEAFTPLLEGIITPDSVVEQQ